MNYNEKSAGGGPRFLGKAVDQYLFDDLHFTSTPTKRQRILAWLIIASRMGYRVTRFDAEYLHDHCLNTTISEIGRIDGICVSRMPTKRPNWLGKQVDCVEYWLADEVTDQAEANLRAIADGLVA